MVTASLMIHHLPPDLHMTGLREICCALKPEDDFERRFCATKYISIHLPGIEIWGRRFA
jgi:hypothetical protein